MKKIILTLAIIFSIFSAKANNKFSELNLKIYDNGVFNVVIDNISFVSYSNSIVIPNLNSGNHFLKVFKYVHSTGNHYGNQTKTVFAGFVFISGGFKINAIIDNLNRYTELSKFPIHNYDNNYSNNYYNSNNDCDEDDYFETPYNNNYYTCMSANNFMQLKSVICNSAFDSSKLKIAEQAVSSNFVSAEQVAELLSMLSFESSKLQLAKFAYKNTVNKNKYFLVNNEFSFSSSIDELNKFISCGF